MQLDQFLLGAFVYLAAAVISAPLFARLGLGSVLGYLIAGVVIGPSVLGLAGNNTDGVMHFAEFGVIVMLFLVGLELQPSKLWELRKPILGLGSLQVAATAAVLGGVAWLAGHAWEAALVAGLALAMSSTAIVVQSLTERGLLKTAAGRSSFAVLLFQDVSVIPMLALLPLLAQGVAVDDHSLTAGLPGWAHTIAVLGAVAAIMLGGRYLTRPVFRWVAGTGIREIFVAFALLIVVGITLLMQLVGLSAALGTFLAGVVLADSEYRHELEMDLDPFKGLLLAVFFIAVGSGIDFGLLARMPVMLLGTVAAVIVLKLLVLLPLARAFRMPLADATRFAFSLAQGGEFAFVLVSFALGLKLIGGDEAGLLVAAVAISMAFAPLLMMLDDRVLQPRFAASGMSRAADRIEADTPEAIIAGHGRFGMTIGRLLQANRVRVVVLDHDAEQIDALRKYGFKIFYGDASRLDLLEAAGAKDAKVLVIAIDDREKTLTMIETARKHFPHLKVFARAFDRVHAYELLNAGIVDVYREVFGSSVDMGRDVLTALGRHPFEAQRAAALFKAHDERMTRVSAEHQGDTSTLIDTWRKSRAEIANVLAEDRGEVTTDADPAWSAPDREDA